MGTHLKREQAMCQQFIIIANMGAFTPDALFPKREGWLDEKPVTVELIGQDATSRQYSFRLMYDDKIFEFRVLPGTKISTGTLCCTKAIVLTSGSVHQEHYHTAADKVLASILTIFYHMQVRCSPAFHKVDDRERSLSNVTCAGKLNFFTARRTATT
ncbi:MAG: hypothetical protein L3J28_02960 [Candidatus Polarisedimenticolaceae bacterium]|nr:hypothetical protein [Candidatus Polarisedimenticolaceae bacterium]